jgi:hypothetical protein
MEVLMWQTQASGLWLREDEYSWQGAFGDDPLFFVRRSKYEPHVLTDLLFGNLGDNTLEHLLAAFIVATGGLSGDRIVFSAIGTIDDDRSITLEKYDRTVLIGRNVSVLLGRMTKDCVLDPKDGHWNALLRLHPQG